MVAEVSRVKAARLRRFTSPWPGVWNSSRLNRLRASARRSVVGHGPSSPLRKTMVRNGSTSAV